MDPSEPPWIRPHSAMDPPEPPWIRHGGGGGGVRGGAEGGSASPDPVLASSPREGGRPSSTWSRRGREGAPAPLVPTPPPDQASPRPLRLVPPSPPPLQSLAQCTRDLTAGQCTWCLTTYISKLQAEFPKDPGGSIKGFSCYVRYRIGAFDITLPPTPPPSSPKPSPAVSTGLAIGLSVLGSALFLIVLGLSIWLLWRRRRRRSQQTTVEELEEGNFYDDDLEMEDDFEKGTGPKRFRYNELAMATNNFSDRQKLGEGGFGSVYRGFLNDMNLDVAIKRVSKSSRQGRKEYASEVRIISRHRHRNLVQLVGWCHGGGELLLVYELMPNGSLDTHLYSANNDTLPWPFRHEIVLGLGSSLLYLHQECE